MKKLLALVSSLFISSTASGSELVEFSTSMDFDEFAVVLKHLGSTNAELSQELGAEISKFKDTTKPGDQIERKLSSTEGVLILEREDDYAFGIIVFATPQTHSELESAFENGTEELGI